MPIRYRTRDLCAAPATARERVLAGAAHLDAVAPGWDTLIDVGRLDIGDSWACVLGQLNATRVMPVVVNPFRVVERGLSIGIVNEIFNQFGLRPRVVHESYARLTAAWKGLILARRAGDPSEPRRADAATEPARPAVAC